MRIAYGLAAVLAIGLLTAANSNNPNSELVPLVQPAPIAPKHPKKLTLTGGAMACTQITRTDGGSNPGQCIRIWSGVDATYDVGVFLSDGGISTGDGVNYGATGDSNQLPNLSVESLCLTASQDGICFFSGDGGIAYVGARWP